MKKIQKLSQEIINQIAAGEVIERPASVIKELVDNSIDAGATRIGISIEDGGKKLIIVEDNGTGIPKDQLASAFEAHTTSKINTFEDLNDLMTMGFRGEALSTIVAVSRTSAITKTRDSNVGYKIQFEGIEPLPIEEFPAKDGTLINIQDLFYNIPARQKYLRTDETEYRNILKILAPYFLKYSDIHFILKKDGKITYNLPPTKETDQKFEISRIERTLRSDFTKDMIPLFYQGNGMIVDGYIARPSFHKSRIQVAYTYINDRPVNDNGIFKSIMQGFGSYIPHGDKVPFIVSVELPSSMVDVNVHPRKEEVRFINPFCSSVLIDKPNLIFKFNY